MANSIDLLKSLNSKVATKTKKGVSRFPRRASDFVLKAEKKYPLYPFDNFIATVEFFAKAENLEKFEDPIALVKSIYDYRDIYYSDVMEKSEAKEIGLFFNISGKKIKDAIDGKIKALQMKFAERKAKQPQPEIKPYDSTNMPYLNEPVEMPKVDWEMKEIERDIERLLAIQRNVEEKKTYNLCEYDLERYGL